MMTKKKFGALDAEHGILTIPMLFYFCQFSLQLTPMISIQNNFERDNSYAKFLFYISNPNENNMLSFKRRPFLCDGIDRENKRDGFSKKNLQGVWK